MHYPVKLLIPFLCLVSLPLQSRPCQVKGVAKDYAGQHVPVYTIANPFLNNRQTFDTVHFDSEGRFDRQLEISHDQVIYFDLGKFIGHIYATPGYEYELLLPPFIRKTHKDRINPFYQQVEVHIKVSSSRSIITGETVEDNVERNNIIYRFDTLFSKMNQEVLIRRQKRIPVNADSMIASLEQQFAYCSSPFFARHRACRYGLLKVNEGKTRMADITSTYLQDRTPGTREPACMDLFNALFDDFLVYYSRTPEGKNVTDAINRRHSLSELRNEVRKHPSIFSDTLADLVILKEISHQYHENYFIRDALLIILDSLSSQALLDSFRHFAAEIYGRYVNLTIGNTPPGFRLRDQSGKSRTLDDFKGKYAYIFFCTTDNYSCMSEYPYLGSFYRKHSDYLEIVTIMVSENYRQMVDFMEKNDYGWTALYYDDQAEILEDFNVRYFPTAYLVGPDGTLVQSPATLPSEGFQMQFFRIMRSKGEI